MGVTKDIWGKIIFQSHAGPDEHSFIHVLNVCELEIQKKSEDIIDERVKQLFREDFKIDSAN